MSSQSEKTDRVSTVPRAVIHKKILDAAQSRPNVSVEELAATVNGASNDLVERVLDEYGDPAESDQTANEAEHETSENQSEMSQTKTNGTTSDASEQRTHEREQESVEVTEKQWEALRAIQERPNATQADLAERFDVSQSTINNRLNSINGFDWNHRREFAESMLDSNNSPQDEAAPGSASVKELTNQVLDLTEQIEAVERRLDEQSTSARSSFDNPDLVCKIMRACMNADDITEEEEVQILKGFITSARPSD